VTDTPQASLPLRGGCACGGVRWEIDAPLESASYCHCTRCQRRSGTAASVQARVKPGSFHIIQGAQLVRDWDPGGGGFLKAFCTDCGSALFSHSPQDDQLVAVRLGTFDADPGIRPQWRQFVAYAASWDEIPDDGLPRYPEGPS
jgi:hypothetical protein